MILNSNAETFPERCHQPVMLDEAVKFLDPRPGGCYVDGTVGAGGHAGAIMGKVQGQARLLGLDRDPEALRLAARVLSAYAPCLKLSNFDAAGAVMKDLDFSPAQGILLDLGVSSMQLDQGERGFSFMKDAPLDMRMSAEGINAAQLIASSSREELKNIIKRYGEEPFAGPIARRLAGVRVETTAHLSRLVEEALPAGERRRRKIHPATLVFQALRIAVNDELGCLQRFLDGIPGLLAPGGRMVIISYHSLEDRLVKQAFNSYAHPCLCPPHLPVCGCGAKAAFRLLSKRPLRPADREVARNPRSRSARMRILEAL
ncbi:MAG: 16S rRNA (cytosine(1402)-N(4))-methyltransferase RsmH [Desulfarculales bacterium]|jgi:16S rRNA (cytosine1402-N4)-methyltransferase|nr:16S rRNA (cytosine(1402)-N(4))-methyltransferase RsmH [Desulfarculales bacterium]